MGKRNKRKVNFFKSLKFRIILMVLISAVISSAIIMVMVVPESKTSLTNTVQSSIFSMCRSYGKLIETVNANVDEMTYGNYSDLLTEAKIDGVESSYAYVVSSDGTMLYHPTKEKVGNPVENTVVSGLVDDIKNGNNPEDAVVTYVFNGKMKYAGYHILNNKNILVISADEEEILAPVDSIAFKAFLSVCFVLIFILVAAWIASTRISVPIFKIAEIISNVADFDFRRDGNLGKITKRSDETGIMARAVDKMSMQMREMIAQMDNVNTQITESVGELKEISIDINSTCTDNSATTEQLAAGMQEASATSETIHSNIVYMNERADGIRELSVNGEKLSDEIKVRAQELQNRTKSATERTKDMFGSVKEETEEAAEQAKAVDKINQLTGAIMEIASQTNLLALNASIEAARAGEAGKGFAVVASEIGNLANQSSETVGNINVILEEISEAVKHMLKSMEDTTDFLENTVLEDYIQFEEVSRQYKEDADTVNDSMRGIEDSIVRLTDTMEEISTALGGINSTIGESATGVSDIAEKTTDIVSKTMRNQELVDECFVTVDELNKLMSSFTLD